MLGLGELEALKFLLPGSTGSSLPFTPELIGAEQLAAGGSSLAPKVARDCVPVVGIAGARLRRVARAAVAAQHPPHVRRAAARPLLPPPRPLPPRPNTFIATNIEI